MSSSICPSQLQRNTSIKILCSVHGAMLKEPELRWTVTRTETVVAYISPPRSNTTPPPVNDPVVSRKIRSHMINDQAL